MIETSGHDPLCMLPKGFGDCICAELAAAEQRGMRQAHDSVPALQQYGIEKYHEGQRDALAEAVQRVEALSHETCAECCEVDVLAALRALGGSDA